MNRTNDTPVKLSWSDVRQTIESLPRATVLLAAGGAMLVVGVLGALLSSSPPPPEIRS
jgi:hypothetical protein